MDGVKVALGNKGMMVEVRNNAYMHELLERVSECVSRAVLC